MQSLMIIVTLTELALEDSIISSVQESFFYDKYFHSRDIIIQDQRKRPFGFAKPRTSMLQHSNTMLVGVNFSSY